MDRREQLFNTKRPGEIDSSRIPTHVNFMFHKNAPQRQRGELRQLTPEEKMLCALRKVLAQMSADSGGEQRYFVAGDQCRILDRHVSPGAKEGEAGSYRFKGRCQIGVSHKSGEGSFKVVEFVVSFRDVEDSMGLPDVDYFDETTLEELDPRTTL